MKRAIYMYQGFLEGTENTGSERAHREVVRNYVGPHLMTPLPYEWTADAKAHAAQARRYGIEEVMILAFSHGNHAARIFAQEFVNLGGRVHAMGFCDPIYRPRWAPRKTSFQWLSLRAWRRFRRTVSIKLPPIAMRVFGVRQQIDKLLRGHEIETTDPRTQLTEIRTLPYTHTVIDGAPEWHDMIDAEIKNWLNDETLP